MPAVCDNFIAYINPTILKLGAFLRYWDADLPYVFSYGRRERKGTGRQPTLLSMQVTIGYKTAQRVFFILL